MFNCVIPAVMTVSAFLICLVAALILGALTALVFSFRSEHSSNLPFALVLVPPIVTLVIMMVNGNIGAGLGVAGAFSLIRFRSAPGTAPLWLARLLSDQRVFPTSFSKYGTCYKNHILSEYFNGVIVCV